MKFFTSDLHFGSDESIITDARPFKDASDFENQVIKQWNKVTRKDDVIYVIGDLIDCHSADTLKPVKELEVVKKIKAKIVLILGNNEERIIKYHFDDDYDKFREHCLALGYLDVKREDDIIIGGVEFHLTHKAKDHVEGKLNLFGHSHKAMGQYKSFGFHIGCDLNNYQPYSEKDIMKLVQKKYEYWDKDQNLRLV